MPTNIHNNIDDPYPRIALPDEQSITPQGIAQRLIETCVSVLEALRSQLGGQLELPATFGGHLVNSDSRADYVYLLSWLLSHGTREIAGTTIRETIFSELERINPAESDGFTSYRLAETVLRLGGIGALSGSQREHILAAIEPKEYLKIVERNVPPKNFAVVVARCYYMRDQLLGGVPSDDYTRVLREFVRPIFEQPRYWMNDGDGNQFRYDIYTPDSYLFAEPFAHDIKGWKAGFTQIMTDLDRIAIPGGAVVWGRSIGALSLALTIELAAAAVKLGLETAPVWLNRADQALTQLRKWFQGGSITAQRTKRPMYYRGIARRLQMTFDILGKLLYAERTLAAASPHTGMGVDPWYDVNELLPLSDSNACAIWVVRKPSLQFIVPFMGDQTVEYMASPRAPGLFEQPTTSYPTFMPFYARMEKGNEVRYIPAGTPQEAVYTGDGVKIKYHMWSATSTLAKQDDRRIRGERRALFTTSGRKLQVSETLTINATPPDDGARVVLLVPEKADRPLEVEITASIPYSQTRVDVSGVPEWWGFYGEVESVHEISFPARLSPLHFKWTVKPRLRIASTAHGQQYDTLLYSGLENAIVKVDLGRPGHDLASRLNNVDILHIGWPEWWAGTNPETTAHIIDILSRKKVKIVWTAHNLLPHFRKDSVAAQCYSMWAKAADLVFHHSKCGMAIIRKEYDFEKAVHIVLPHGHWGPLYEKLGNVDRRKTELAEGWPPCQMRLGIIGSPREEKQLQLAINAFARCSRQDLQLVVRTDGLAKVPDDSRIIPNSGHVESEQYLKRVLACDALIFPFTPQGMLTTGTAFDAIGAGIPPITSNWSFFDETFSGADIRYGTTQDDLTSCLETLDPDTLAASAKRLSRQKRLCDWTDIGQVALKRMTELVDKM